MYSPSNSFLTIYFIWMSVNRSTSIWAFLKVAFHANPGYERNFSGSNWQISKHILLEFSKTSTGSNVLLLKYKSWYSSKFFISKSLQTPYHYHCYHYHCYHCYHITLSLFLNLSFGYSVRLLNNLYCKMGTFILLNCPWCFHIQENNNNLYI